MRAAIELSALRGHLDRSTAQSLNEFFAKLPTPAISGKIEPKALLSYLRRDKKAERGKVRFVLLKEIGQPISDKEITDQQILQAIHPIFIKWFELTAVRLF